jgi:hypothetical protein
VEKTQAEIMAELEEDYRQAREKGMACPRISGYYSKPL